MRAVSTELEVYSATDYDCIALENYCAWLGAEKLVMARQFPSILKGCILEKLLQEEEFQLERFVFLEEEPSPVGPPTTVPHLCFLLSLGYIPGHLFCHFFY